MRRHLFVMGADLGAESVSIVGADRHHLVTVLRLRRGDELTLLDGRGAAAHAVIKSVGAQEVVAGITGPAETWPEPDLHITVAQALGKNDRFEQVVQHGTEVGASAFIPLVTERGVVRLDPNVLPAKLERWRQIAKNASEQCGRARVPEVLSQHTVAYVTREFARPAVVIMLEREGEPLRETLAREASRLEPDEPPRKVILLVGPEGGFTPTEIGVARAAGAHLCRCAEYTLRTETAALVAITRILNERK